MELDEFRKLYPSFQLTDKLLLKGMEMSYGARPTRGASDEVAGNKELTPV
jgi:hypothetical protein